MTCDTARLKALATAAQADRGDCDDILDEFHDAAHPQAVLGLIARVEELELRQAAGEIFDAVNQPGSLPAALIGLPSGREAVTRAQHEPSSLTIEREAKVRVTIAAGAGLRHRYASALLAALDAARANNSEILARVNRTIAAAEQLQRIERESAALREALREIVAVDNTGDYIITSREFMRQVAHSALGEKP